MAHTVRLGTWNIQLGYQLETILQVIKEYREFASLDLLALQEASIHEDAEDAQAIAHALGPTFQSAQVTAHLIGKLPQANAILWNTSRVSISRLDTVNLPRWEEVTLSQIERTLLGALPQQQRTSIVADGMLDGESIRAACHATVTSPIRFRLLHSRYPVTVQAEELQTSHNIMRYSHESILPPV